jgi:hypothetical protein
LVCRKIWSKEIRTRYHKKVGYRDVTVVGEQAVQQIVHALVPVVVVSVLPAPVAAAAVVLVVAD